MTQYYITAEDSMLLIIDIQQRLFTAIEDGEAENVTRNSIILTKTAHELHMPVLITEQYKKGLGETIQPIAEAAGCVKVMEKLHFDCCKDQAIKEQINSYEKNTVIICGIESHVCVLQTALNLLSQNKNVVIVSNAVASRNRHDRDTAIDTLRSAGAVIYPAESIVFMLLEVAGTPQFKALAPLVR